MAIYTDHRFDDRHQTAVTVFAPLGPHGRSSSASIRSKALPGYTGWHHVTFYADYHETMEASTRNVLELAAEWEAMWRRELFRRFHQDNKD